MGNHAAKCGACTQEPKTNSEGDRGEEEEEQENEKDEDEEDKE